MKNALLIFLLLLFVYPAFGQVPVATHVQILKAEDARRYDKVLEDLLKSPNAAIRVRAALAAGRIGDKAAVPALVRLLNDSSEKVREMAAFALGEVESIDAADAIRIALGETASAQLPGAEKANVRGRLVEAAGKIAAANAQDTKAKELGETIKFILASEKEKPTSTETARLALTAALRARPAGAEENIRFFLSHSDPGVVSDALNTLARLRAKNANRDARDLLETNTHAVVRANAARLLGAAEDKEAVDLLIKAATSDQDSRVRVSAIRSLATLKDDRAAVALEAYQDSLVEKVSAREKKGRAGSNVQPPEVSEILEITTAIGNILAGKKPAPRVTTNPRLYEEAPANLIGPIVQSAETSIARAKIDPDLLMLGLLDRVKTAPPPMFRNWRSYSNLAQGMAVLAGLKKEAYGDSLERNRREAEEILRLWLSEGRLPPNAVPDVLTAYAAFKPEDLQETLAEYLSSSDVFVRAATAGLIADQPKTRGMSALLEKAFLSALSTDKHDNDAQLATLDAMAKVDSSASVDTIYKALDSPDYLVRKRAFGLLVDPKLLAAYPGAANVARDARARHKDQVWQYDAKTGTKLGQMLSKDADYRRALSRKNGSVRAVFTTQKGSFTIEFLPEDAPLTVDNFVKLARAGYFNGLEVHRVVPNFVMQDGDPRGDGNGGPGWSIRCEVNMVPYERGAVGMALSGKDTGGSQWFVTHSPQPHLDGGYTVFGRVNETGMKVVDRIVRGDKIVSVRIVGR